MKNSFPDSDWVNPMNPPAVTLAKASPPLYAMLEQWLEKVGETELIKQLPIVWVLAQTPLGTPESFSFVAYPLPGPNYEERCAMELQEERVISLDEGGKHVELTVGDFGEISRLTISGYPEMFREIVSAIKINFHKE